MNDMIEGSPLPEPLPEPEAQPQAELMSLPEISAESEHSTEFIETESALVPATDSIIEGEFTDVLPPEPAQKISGNPPKNTKRKISPALLALIAILIIFTLCCLMAVIVFFLVYPAAVSQGAAMGAAGLNPGLF